MPNDGLWEEVWARVSQPQGLTFSENGVFSGIGFFGISQEEEEEALLEDW